MKRGEVMAWNEKVVKLRVSNFVTFVTFLNNGSNI